MKYFLIPAVRKLEPKDDVSLLPFMEYFFVPVSIVKKIELSDLADWLKVPCPCGNCILFVYLPFDGRYFECPCGEKLILENRQWKWNLAPEDGVWKIEPGPCKCCFS